MPLSWVLVAAGSLAFLGFWQHNASLCSSSHGYLLLVSVSKFPPSYKDAIQWIMIQQSYELILT